MPETDPVSPFYLAIEDDPDDRVSLLALADWFEEHDELVAADCLRWTVKYGRRPYCYPADGGLTVSSPDWHVGWFWWAVDDAAHTRDWGYPSHCRLPRTVWARLRHGFRHAPSVFKEYPSVRAAYEALIDVWEFAAPIERRTPAREERR
jgi:uncharacterized protein (TIGR02996 family)